MPTHSPTHEPGTLNLSAWVCAALAMAIMAALLQAIATLAQVQVQNAHSRDTRLLVQEARQRYCLAETRWEERARCETPDAPVETANVWPPHHPLNTEVASAR